MMKKCIIIFVVLVVFFIGGVVIGVYVSGNFVKDNNESKIIVKKVIFIFKKVIDIEKKEIIIKEVIIKDFVMDDKGVVIKGSLDVEKNVLVKNNSSVIDKSNSLIILVFLLFSIGFKIFNVFFVFGGIVIIMYLLSVLLFEKIFENLMIEVN